MSFPTPSKIYELYSSQPINIMSFTHTASAFILYSRSRLPALKLEFPSESLEFFTLRLHHEFGGTQEASQEAAETSGCAPADLLCISCNSSSSDVGGWKILNEAFAMDHATGLFGNEAFVRVYNSTSAIPTTVQGAPQFFVETRLASRYGRCWHCPSCP